MLVYLQCWMMIATGKIVSDELCLVWSGWLVLCSHTFLLRVALLFHNQ